MYIVMFLQPILEPMIEMYKIEERDPFYVNFHKLYSSADSFNAHANKGKKDL